MKKVLESRHFSQETAYVIEDWPYGRSLRCKKRFWIEEGKKHGLRAYRFCSQTTNPKVEGELWNKPKKSTYYVLAAVMYIDEEDKIQFAGCSLYDDSDDLRKFFETFRDGLTMKMEEDIADMAHEKRKE